MDSTRWFDWSFWKAASTRAAEWAVGALPSLVVVLLAGWLALRASAFVLKRLDIALRKRHAANADAPPSETHRRIDTLVTIARTAVRSVLWCLIILLALVQLGINVGPLIAGAGIVGLAIGFGAQELVRDVISGFFMLMENDIRRGDWVIINGTAGYVEHVTLRTVALRDEGGVVHIFQNGKITSLSNTSKDWSAVLLDVAISYDEDVDRAIGVLTRASLEISADKALAKKIIAPLEVLGVETFDDTKTVIRVRIKTLPLANFEVSRAYRKLLVRAFHALDVRMPEASQTMHVIDRTPRRPPPLPQQAPPSAPLSFDGRNRARAGLF